MAFPIPNDKIQERPTTRARLEYLLTRVLHCLPESTPADLLGAMTDLCETKAKDASTDRDMEQWALASSLMEKAREMIDRL